MYLVSAVSIDYKEESLKMQLETSYEKFESGAGKLTGPHHFYPGVLRGLENLSGHAVLSNLDTVLSAADGTGEFPRFLPAQGIQGLVQHL